MFGRSLTTTHRARISVRARTNAYPAASLVWVFLACFFIYIDHEYFAAVFAGLALISFPVLALSDRIVFDGRRLTRTGLIWRAFLSATGRRNRIAPRRIVHVETSTFRVFRRGTNISYLYRTTFHAPDFTFEIGSGPGYRRMIMTLLPLISDSCLDIRSAELREHFVDAPQRAAR